MHTLNFFKDAVKAFGDGNYARLTVVKNRVYMINTITGSRHVFADGNEEIVIRDKKLLTKIKQL